MTLPSFSMIDVIWFLISLMVGIRSVTCEYQCNMTTAIISCTNIQHDEASDGIKVTLDNVEVGYLNISNSNITNITQETFGRFPFLHTLYITNAGVKSVQPEAFWNNTNLREVHLTDNFLVELSSNAFVNNNFIKTLDLSNNVLEDISGFNMSGFSEISVLNLTNNRLKYLPGNMIEKLREKNEFYIVINNNPFDCKHPNWSTYLTQELIDVFCTNNTYVPIMTFPAERFVDIQNLQEDIIIDSEIEGSGEKTVSEKNYPKAPENELSIKEAHCTFACSFNYCIAWFAGGVWVGVIVGNVLKIKKLICHNSANRTLDKNTQYDPADYSLKLLPKI